MSRPPLVLPPLVLLGAALVLFGAGCTASDALGDQARCPGATCTEDVQERFDAIADLEAVTRVEEVSRTSGLDRGVFHAAEVEASVADAEAARGVALAVLGELDAWPDRDPTSAEVTVLAAPPTPVPGAARESEALPTHYAPCATRDCRDELADLRGRLSTEVDGVFDVALEVSGNRLVISGRAEPEQAALAAREALGLVEEEAIALADRVEIVFSYRSPLQLTLRLVDDLVCEQPPGAAVVSCEEENSIPFKP